MSWSADSIRTAIVDTVPLVEEKQSSMCHVRRAKRFRGDCSDDVDDIFAIKDDHESDAESHASLDN